MNSPHSKETLGDFTLHTLESGQLRLSLVPELGGRIVSIYDREGDREWLDGWQPESERRLWAPSDAGVYDSGPGAGIDECLPTVLSCRVGGRELPDHGDVWSGLARVDDSLVNEGVLGCAWTLSSLPLKFARTVTLKDDEIRLSYRLENRGEGPTPFQWAWHPLFTLEEGDQICFDDSVRECRNPGLEGEVFPWPEARVGQDLSRAELASSSASCAKVFIGPLQEGRAEIRGLASVMQMQWPAGLFPWAGVWITRGFWKGLHHWAVEPTNCPVDRLSDAVVDDPLTTLAPGEKREWELVLRVGRP